ncbi:hypothetical protein M422DRAFT_54675 [Sphaerobolus stellatus SS14]|uniref:USP8 dimerisation domain-containing protein n=1 Tax=Sphaerobolus stellatus (strain SS14) TaxID=990650 RepID=A0A0C9TFY6_SPHS4|nr:hypothetical protein M422DRAFT_54675 [Sphaerobolus stellatus SS14]
MPNPRYLKYIPGPEYIPEVQSNLYIDAAYTIFFHVKTSRNLHQKSRQYDVAVSVKVHTPRTHLSFPLNDRPHSIEELAKIAAAGRPPAEEFNRDMEAAMRFMSVLLHQAIEDHTRGDLQMAFVNYVRVAHILTGHLLSHPDYDENDYKLVDANTKRSIAVLAQIERLKVELDGRYRAWRARHPDVNPTLDMPYILNTIAAHDKEELEIRRRFSSRIPVVDSEEEGEPPPAKRTEEPPIQSHGKIMRQPSQNSRSISSTSTAGYQSNLGVTSHSRQPSQERSSKSRHEEYEPQREDARGRRVPEMDLHGKGREVEPARLGEERTSRARSQMRVSNTSASSRRPTTCN